MSATRSNELVLEEIRDAQRLEQLRSHWQRLLSRSASATPFNSWEWLVTWWECLAPRGGRLCVLAVWSGSTLVAVAPMLRRAPQRLELLGGDTVGSDYLDVVCQRTWEVAVSKALADWLHRQPQTLRCVRLLPAALLATHLARALERRGWRLSKRADEACPFIPLAEHDWESFVSGLGQQHRANLRRKLRRIQRDFHMQLDIAESEPQRARMLEELFVLHQRRWDGRGTSEAFQTPANRRFHHRVSRRMLERGWLRLFVLRLDETPAAGLYGLCRGQTFYFFQSGFEPTFAKYSPGLVMMGLSIKHAIAAGCTEYDMLHGTEPYKFLWAKETRALHRIECFPPTLWGYLDQRRATALQRMRGVARVATASAGPVWRRMNAKTAPYLRRRGD